MEGLKFLQDKKPNAFKEAVKEMAVVMLLRTKARSGNDYNKRIIDAYTTYDN